MRFAVFAGTALTGKCTPTSQFMFCVALILVHSLSVELCWFRVAWSQINDNVDLVFARKLEL